MKILPCPACSFLDIDGMADLILFPMVVRRRLTGGFMLAGCSTACGLCNVMLKRDTEEEVAQAWQARVEEVARHTDNLWLKTKVPRTLERLQRRGLLPANFVMPPGQKDGETISPSDNQTFVPSASAIGCWVLGVGCSMFCLSRMFCLS